ncbi:MAG: MoaD family protein [Synergistales bacterium]|nr:MoaD family protein [Synergistales bacterium]
MRLYNFLFHTLGKKELLLSGPANVRELLAYLSENYGDKVDKWLWKGKGKDRTLIAGTMILVNGRHVCHLNGLDTPLRDDDTVSIFPPAGGG